jgi:hypothetical protein
MILSEGRRWLQLAALVNGFFTITQTLLRASTG